MYFIILNKVFLKYFKLQDISDIKHMKRLKVMKILIITCNINIKKKLQTQLVRTKC